MNPNSQIAREYNRTLDEYAWALDEAIRHIHQELASLKNNRECGYRHYIRHALLQLADTIATTDTKLSVFGNFTWAPTESDQ